MERGFLYDLGMMFPISLKEYLDVRSKKKSDANKTEPCRNNRLNNRRMALVLGVNRFVFIDNRHVEFLKSKIEIGGDSPWAH